MAFDYGLTNAADPWRPACELVAAAAQNQLKTLYGYDDATAYAHLGLQLMNGHTDQPSELFTQATFTDPAPRTPVASTSAGSRSGHSTATGRATRGPHNWADGTCSSVSQNPYDFARIVASYAG